CLCTRRLLILVHSFSFSAAAPTHLYPLSLHDALPISVAGQPTGAYSAFSIVDKEVVWSQVYHTEHPADTLERRVWQMLVRKPWVDRKSTRLNSSHVKISYAVFCLKKKTRTSTRRLPTT